MTEGRIFFLKFDRVSPNIEHWTPMAALKRRSPNLSYRRKYIGVSDVSSAPSPPCIPFSLLLPAYVHIRRLVALEKYIVLACKCATLARGHGSVCYIVPAGRSGFSHLCRTLGPSAGQREKHARALLVCVSGYHRGSRHESEPLHPPSKSPIYALTQMTNAPSTWREKLVEDHRGG